jgi:hypothetical protein
VLVRHTEVRGSLSVIPRPTPPYLPTAGRKDLHPQLARPGGHTKKGPVLFTGPKDFAIEVVNMRIFF